MPRLRAVVADDHPVFLDGVRRLLDAHPDIEVVATATGGKEALAAIRARRPDVAVLDLRLPDLDGTAVIAAVRREHLPVHVLVLSAVTDGAAVYRALEAGATGYVAKLGGADAIVLATLAVARGRTVVPPELRAGLAAAIRARRDPDRPVLDGEETAIVRLAADGCSNAEIARRLDMAPADVRARLDELYERLEVPDRAAAVARALRLGLVT